MSTLDSIYNATQQLSEHLEHPLPNKDDARSDYLDIIDFLLEKRALKLATLVINEGEKKQAQFYEIAAMNEVIEKKIKGVKAEIGRDLQQTRMQQSAETKYIYSYNAPSVEGLYFDKKN
ncbi:flagellar protein FliT [Geomicrobium halophilum]|uniref:Flagellar protein FliT n=1 Tax=Geomicrobium halophilum TaxID=549000 RepID=A0A841PNF0_9BACL|nr:hypothetical protein [Geomicrobium halophilum]MBB6450367.1 flagellar protein FliT [Geomicrobium halophilum]